MICTISNSLCASSANRRRSRSPHSLPSRSVSGANLAIFAVVNSILLRPLPFPQSDRLVTIYNTYPKAGVENDGSSITNYYERRGHIAAFSSLSLYRDGAEVLGNPGSTEQVEVMRISPEFFATLGVNLAMGRTFTEAEAPWRKITESSF